MSYTSERPQNNLSSPFIFPVEPGDSNASNTPSLSPKPGLSMDGVIADGISFKNMCLRDANLSEGRFTGCNFNGADLSLACLVDSTFMQCSFVGTIWCAANLNGVVFDQCAFDRAEEMQIRKSRRKRRSRKDGFI